MVFNSTVFFLFFLIFYIVYWFLNNKLPIVCRNIFTLIASYFFYGWWDWRFLGLLIISSTADYINGLLIYRAKSTYKKRILLFISICINLGILCFFKYYNFFIESFTSLMSTFSVSLNVQTLKIILPVGISFYTFQSLSYTIDIFRGKLKPTKDPVLFFTFISFFPQLVAGPIERASNLLYQFREKKAFSYENSIYGLRLSLWGFFKKIVIADNLGLIVDQIFNKKTSPTTITTIVGCFLFAFQIYCDFSGYSDVAIGIAKMLGFEFKRNFITPYFSKSFTEFWHRWHISLSSWFRDYVYIPLGGSKQNKTGPI
jgi:alginate O-acetyltransferase complex protein AlgI